MSEDPGRPALIHDDLLALFDADHLIQVLNAEDHNCKEGNLTLNFARFVAVYYLNLCVPEAEANVDVQLSKIPNLFTLEPLWNDVEVRGAALREMCAKRLSAEYTPSMVTQLLWRSDRWLEALLFLDHFNDFRSQLMCRRMFDERFGTELFADHCRKCLVDDWFVMIQRSDDACGGEHDLLLTETMVRHVDALLQLDVLFGMSLLETLKRRTMRFIEEKLFLLNDDVDPSVGLPRPPIYARPCPGADCVELRVWNCVHYALHTLLLCLSRTNCLETLLRRTNLWLLSSNQQPSELSYLLDSELLLNRSDEETLPSEGDVDLFERIVLCVLQLALRDSITIYWRNVAQSDSNQPDELRGLEDKFALLFTQCGCRTDEWGGDISTTAGGGGECCCAGGGAGAILRRWASSLNGEGNLEEFALLVDFFDFIARQFRQVERYLPMLTESTADQWRSTLLSPLILEQSSRRCKERTEKISSIHRLIPDDKKLEVSLDEWIRLRFISQRFPKISLHELCASGGEPLVQIAVRIDPHDFAIPIANACVSDLREGKCGVLSSRNGFVLPSQNQGKGGDPSAKINDTIDSHERLLENIRKSVSRLGEIVDSNDDNDTEDEDINIGVTCWARQRTDASATFSTLLADAEMERIRRELDDQRMAIARLAAETSRRSAEIVDFIGNSTGRENQSSSRSGRKSRRIVRYEELDESEKKTDTSPKVINKMSESGYTASNSATKLHQRQRPPSYAPSSSDSGAETSALNSDTLRAEIVEIGHRLSALRQVLHSDSGNREEEPATQANVKCTGDRNDDDSEVDSGRQSVDQAISSASSSLHIIAASTTTARNGIERLDLSTLSSSPKKRGTHQWTELEVLPRPMPMTVSVTRQKSPNEKPCSERKPVEERSSTTTHDKRRSIAERMPIPPQLPGWLTLIPVARPTNRKRWHRSAGPSRCWSDYVKVLQISAANVRHTGKPKGDVKKVLRDSTAFLRSSHDVRAEPLLFSCDMTAEETNLLLQQSGIRPVK